MYRYFALIPYDYFNSSLFISSAFLLIYVLDDELIILLIYDKLLEVFKDILHPIFLAAVI